MSGARSWTPNMPGVDLVNGWLHVSKTDNSDELRS